MVAIILQKGFSVVFGTTKLLIPSEMAFEITKEYHQIKKASGFPEACVKLSQSKPT